MEIKKLFEDFEKHYLFVGDERVQNSKYHDKKLNKIDVMNSFSVFVNYHSNTCIHILKDTQLTTQLWRDLCKKYDMTKLNLNYEKLYNLI
jgi:hypothetical protein